MATNVDKALYQAPQGMAMLAEPDIEIEIEDPESVSIGMGDIEIDLKPQKNSRYVNANLAEYMDDNDLDSLGQDLVEDFGKDIQDRRDWIRTYVDGLKLLGLQYEERNRTLARCVWCVSPYVD
jgi:hypothetical protein